MLNSNMISLRKVRDPWRARKWGKTSPPLVVMLKIKRGRVRDQKSKLVKATTIVNNMFNFKVAAYRMDRVALGVPAVNIHTEVIVSSLALKTGNWHYRQTGHYILYLEQLCYQLTVLLSNINCLILLLVSDYQ